MRGRPHAKCWAATGVITSFLAAAVVFPACWFTNRARSRANAPRIHSEALRAAFAQPQTALKQSRKPLAFTDGVFIRDCSSYLTALRAGSTVADTVEAQTVASEYLICDGIDALRCAEGLGAGARASEPARELANRLDMRHIPSSASPQVDGNTHTLSQLGDVVEVSETTVALELEESNLRFEIVAEADVNGDGKTDWIVWFADEAKGGNDRGYVTLLVPSPGEPGLLSASPWPASGAPPCKALQGPESYR